ncbi:RecX family transcriptional regulator [Defluviitalea phaphyphila]|uniref:RecX family transcriptional regulator n=1 Tax=Defluviitalea phaphyphila TaxID=1473580 RepID=UPI000730F4E1|nr:RecX family transcriptional regulator [Defluviitalea phaphyphila]
MKITKIEKQKNNKNRWSIFIDGEFSFGVDAEELYMFKLYEGKNINKKELIQIIKEKDYNKAKNIALNFLSYRPRSEKEIRNKLASKEYDEAIIEKVIDFLKKYDYVNDEKFAINYVKYYTHTKILGKKKIEYDLKQKGIKQKIIENVLNNIELDELNNALKLIEKKCPLKENIDQKKKQKIYQFLLRKGFSYDVIKKAFKIYFD